MKMAITTRGKYKGRKENPPNPDGRATLHGARKKARNLSLTDDAWSNIKVIAKEHNLSVSELVELIGRGKIKISA